MVLDEMLSVKVPGNLQSTLQMGLTMIMRAIVIIAVIIIYVTINTTKERGGFGCRGEGRQDAGDGSHASDLDQSKVDPSGSPFLDQKPPQPVPW